MVNKQYYDGTKLLSLKDINGNNPEIYICTANRTGGKTTFFNRWAVNKFQQGKGKFMLLYRYSYELDDVADKFFKDIEDLFFQGYCMKSIRRSKGIYHELILMDKNLIECENYEGTSCGYAVALNNSDQIKKLSHIFNDVERIIFDEFQSETNHYCPNEIRKFISVHTSVARGQGQQTRYVPVVMIANPVTIINPYYVELGISSRLRDDTKFLKGDGYVLEQGFVETASRALKESPFNRAFKNNAYIAYSSEAVYLNDSKSFIEKPSGKSSYVCTLKFDGKDYAVREYPETGIVYCDDSVDGTYPVRITVTAEDHGINYVMLKQNEFFLSNLRYYFEKGCFRFKDLRCKEAVLKALSY